MMRVCFNKKLRPFLSGLAQYSCHSHHLQCDIKPAVTVCHSPFLSNVSSVKHTNSVGRKQIFQCRLYSTHKSSGLTHVFWTDNLFQQRTTVLQFLIHVSGSRHSHNLRSKLSLHESVYASFLESLVDEFKSFQDLKLKNVKSYKTEKDKKIYLSRYRFLDSANEVILNMLEKQRERLELKNFCADEKDADMKQMMQIEMQSVEKDMILLEDELIDVLAGEEPADDNDIILEVSAGVGGQEAMLFCVEVFNMYCQYGMGRGWNVTLVSKDESELGGCRKASVEISGLGVYKALKYEAGVHRVQRVPKTEKAGRIHTSTVTVSILPQPREIDVQIEKKDLKIETFRGSGPGGQSVNTTDSAVRITHIPTGTVAECKQERSQLKNKDYAMKVLKLRIYQTQLEEEEANRRATRKMQIGSRGRSEKIRTYNFQQDRITDHRVKENYTNLPDFLAGGEGLDDLIRSLEKDFKYKTVESMLDEFELSLKK